MAATPAAGRPGVAGARRVVIKLGTRVLTHDDGRLALARLFGVVEAAAALTRAGREVLIVSSGAVGLGRDVLALKGKVWLDLATRQTCAAVGQLRLMSLYEEGFSRLGLVCAQVLLTEGDFDERGRYLNLQRALTSMLRRGVVPVINENDVVATDELAFVDEAGARQVFGDNDRLSALVASKLDADLLVLLTDVPGVYDRDPRGDPDARLLERVDDPDALGDAAGESASGAGKGGMRSKVAAASVAARAGCHAVIASGREPGAVERVAAGAAVGTWFPARAEGLDGRRRWIAFATAARGTLHLDAGAVAALRERGASLLAPGVTRVEGSFRSGEVVELVGPDGALVGRGMVGCPAERARAWCGGDAPRAARNRDALVHREHIVLEP